MSVEITDLSTQWILNSLVSCKFIILTALKKALPPVIQVLLTAKNEGHDGNEGCQLHGSTN